MAQDLPRRNFLKSIFTGAALVGGFPKILGDLASGKSEDDKSGRPSAVVFWEAGFPTIDGCGVTRDSLEQALQIFEVIYFSEQNLIDRLNVGSCDLLITPYGSAFPKRAWRALLEYLRGGGNWMNLGGAPLAAPVTRTAAHWRAGNRQTAYHKRLGVTQSFSLKPSAIASYQATGHFSRPSNIQNEFKAEEIYELYARLTSSSDTPDEAGSDGPREALLYPLVFGIDQQQRRVAAPIIQIDRLQGEFAGGRWVLANFSGGINADAIRALAEQAAQGAVQFLAQCDLACYHESEIPSISIQVHRPGGNLEKIIRGDCRLEVYDSTNQTVAQLSVSLVRSARGGEEVTPVKEKVSLMTGIARLKDQTKLAAGLYRAEARVTLNSTTDDSRHELTYTTAFWVYDAAVMTRGRPLTVDSHSFYRGGEVYPVTGTTYMASDVHRKFLFEPNPFLWDQDFREMKEAGVNMVRTGIWTGWKKYMPEAGKVNDVALRALDAFLLTAHKYDIPVIFTLFAFLPEPWGGSNAYLDPRAVKAQQQFVSTFAQRYRNLDDLIWDLINEPSFCSPKHLWSCRPNYDDHEKTAWQQWLKDRYPYPNDEVRASALQQLWRTTSEDSLDLPALEDFEDANIFDTRHPLKTFDYRLFAQEMFTRWVRAMTEAIRSNGNQKQLITVGQDEAGTGDSPNPQFFANAVDFTCLHNWWHNDDLLWDSIMTKSQSKASLVEETGIMFYEKTEGAAWRTEDEASKLLERKMAISLGTDSAGFIEWIWNQNCYMNSDNEAAIGFHRVDQTVKPELEPFRSLSKFVSAHHSLFRGREDERALMVIPHSQMFSPRNFASEATRKCVRAMHYHCRMPFRAVSEYTLSEPDSTAKLIVVPASRVLTQRCWDALVRSADRGATVVISGILDADEHWLPTERGTRFGWAAKSEPVSESEFIVIGGRQYVVRYEGEKIQRIEKAVVTLNAPSRVMIHPQGAGRFIWSPLPLEVGDSLEPLIAFYRYALIQATVFAVFRLSPPTASILVLPALFADAVLYTFVSEADHDVEIQLLHLETKARFWLTVPAERTALVLLDRRSGKLIDSTVKGTRNLSRRELF